MNKKLIDKRVNTFLKCFPNHKISEKGNYYAELGEQFEESNSIEYNGVNATKGLLKKIGEVKSYKKIKTPLVLLMSKKGKLMCKVHYSYRFKTFTLRDLINLNKNNFGAIPDLDKESVRQIFFIGRKFDYLKDMSYLWKYRCAQNFNSLKEMKNFLGYDFISTKKFNELFKKYSNYDDIISFLVKSDNKVNTIAILTNGKIKDLNILKDCYLLSKNLNLEFSVPYGINKLKEIHDDFVVIQNKAKIESFSDIINYYVEPEYNFIKHWEENGLSVKRLDTPRKIYVQGLEQNHCIGSYYSSLNQYGFFSLLYDNKYYDIMLRKNGEIVQFYGQNNDDPPFFLNKIVRDKNINYKFEIKNINETIVPEPIDEDVFFF